MSRLPQILYVTHRVPYPPDKGDRIRTFHILRSLSQKYQVYLACLADEPVSAETETVLRKYCKQLAIIPMNRLKRWGRMGWSILTGGVTSISAFRSHALDSVIWRWADAISFDLTLVSSSAMAPYVRMPALRNTPCVVDLVDVDSEKWKNYADAASFPKSMVFQREGKVLRQYEQHLAKTCDALLLVSDAESDLFRSFMPHAPVQTISNGVDLDFFKPSSTTLKQNQCVFVGALDYLPNIDAVCWFAQEVWPAVKQNCHEATFKIVGRRPSPQVQALSAMAGIEVVGQVPDVRPHVHESSVVIAPLRIARGLQNKVLEAMAMGKPVLSSPAALAGLHKHALHPAVCVTSINDWISQLLQLFSDPLQCQQLGNAGRNYVETWYSWESCMQPLHELFAKIMQKPAESGKIKPLCLGQPSR